MPERRVTFIGLSALGFRVQGLGGALGMSLGIRVSGIGFRVSWPMVYGNPW